MLFVTFNHGFEAREAEFNHILFQRIIIILLQLRYAEGGDFVIGHLICHSAEKKRKIFQTDFIRYFGCRRRT